MKNIQLIQKKAEKEGRGNNDQKGDWNLCNLPINNRWVKK